MARPRKDGAPKAKKKKKKKSKKGAFIRGLVTLLPAVLTIWILITVLQFVNTYLTSPINQGIYGFLEGNGFGWNVLSLMDVEPFDEAYFDPELLPKDLQRELDGYGDWDDPEYQAALTNHREENLLFLRDFELLAIDRDALHDDVDVPPGLGIAISVLIVLILGYLAGGFLGRGMIRSWDRTLSSIPVVRSIYPYTKQLVEFFLSDSELEFDTVVAAPYPTDSVYAIGFVTGPGLRSIDKALGGRRVSVFIPTSPMPMTGFTVFIDEARLVPLDITVDEALRVTISAGVLVPPSETIEELSSAIGELKEPKSPA
jgi:uncharacterized membrane protein